VSAEATFVATIPPCDIDARHGPAYADARLAYVGSWAYVCRDCFDSYGCSLGLGAGQVLLLHPCTVCGVPIHRVVEAHWSGWEDDDDDSLSYVPTLHDHTPDPVTP
jgi:hypothetical protein